MNPPENFVYLLGNIVLFSSVPPLILFVVFYYFKSQWRRFLSGRALMYFAASLLLVLIISLLGAVLGPDYPLREYVRLAGFAVASFSTWRLFFILRRIQKADSTREAEVVVEPVDDCPDCLGAPDSPSN